MKQRLKTVSDEQKMTIQLWLGVSVTIFGCILLICSFFVPPMGIIDASVLAALGELLTFSGALIGIDYNYKYKRFRTENERRNEYPHPHGYAHPQYDAEPVPVDEAGDNGGTYQD